jgi:class 3 adenylate cyclase
MTERADLVHLRHELHTPLNHLIGYSEMLLEELAPAGSEPLADGLGRILAEARRVLARVDDLLAQERIEAGGVDVRALPKALEPSVQAIVDTAEQIRAEAAAGEQAPLVAEIDRISTAARLLLDLAAHGGAVAGESTGPANEPASEPAERPAGGDDTLLVVDDNEGNRDLLARRLVREGHRVLQAGDGTTALATLAREPVDLVLLDVMMPELNGIEVLQRLKADPALRDIPVLMISSLDELDSVVRCIELGAEDYLPKPFNPVLLRARIGACLEKKRLREQEKRHAAELAEWNRRLEERVTQQVAELERVGRLKRFFSPQLAERILAGGADDPLRSHRRELTVVFLDLRGFTAFSETAEPEEVMGVLREYHADMGRVILLHEGTLEHFAGDGMMVFFNDPVPLPNPAERAVRMAIAMRARVGTLVARWRKLGYELDFGVGIAQGYATLGAIGYEGRMEYGAIGTVTNLASRLCGEARPGQILVSRKVLVAVEELVEAEAVGELALKGFHRPMPAFNIVGLRAAAAGPAA